MTPDKKGFPLALRAVTALAPVSLLLLVGACGGGGGSRTTPPTEETRAEPLGSPLAGITTTEKQAFDAGLSTFKEVEEASDGLGPAFNGTSCAECHKRGATGGAGEDLVLTRVTRFGGMVNGAYSDLTEYGGPTIQRRSLQEFDPTYPIPPEVVPPQAQYISHRITTPLFGAGLIEAIPNEEILRNVRPNDRDGVRGKPNWVTNPATGKQEIGRFGWKAQVSTLTVFAADAYLNEMGVTSPLFPHDLLPQGLAIPAGADGKADPEDDGTDVTHFANFMRFLAPASPAPSNAATNHGQAVFLQIGCASCHVPTLHTGKNASAALSNKAVNLFSDLLLHDMGPGLADGVQQGSAKGGEFRTAPLWGLRQRALYLHDGRATTISDAIQAHGGEAGQALNRFFQLRPNDRNDLLAFLGSL